MCFKPFNDGSSRLDYCEICEMTIPEIINCCLIMDEMPSRLSKSEDKAGDEALWGVV